MRTFSKIIAEFNQAEFAVSLNRKLEKPRRTALLYIRWLYILFLAKKSFDEGMREFIGAHKTGVHDGTMDQLEEGKCLFKAMEDPLTVRWYFPLYISLYF